MPPRNDFLCECCGHRDAYFATTAAPPFHCRTPMVWAPRPGSYAMDAYEPGQEFTTEIGGRTVRIESLNDIRKVEREAEARARNGEGQPMIWRDYSQNASNRDVHTLSRTPHKPMDGYDRSNLEGGKVAEKDHGTALAPRPGKFRKRVGEAVTKDHGTV